MMPQRMLVSLHLCRMPCLCPSLSLTLTIQLCQMYCVLVLVLVFKCVLWAHVLTWNFHSKPENLKWCFLFYQKNQMRLLSHFFSAHLSKRYHLLSMFACESVCARVIRVVPKNFSKCVANQPVSHFPSTNERIWTRTNKHRENEREG